MKHINTRRGFTLIELLVVVLIIGILAAVAVPQYQKAVLKSKYAKIKTLTQSIAHAQEVYYLANGKYADDFEQLDVELPGGKLNTSTKNNYKYDWGYCNMGSFYRMTACTDSSAKLQYQIHFLHDATEPGVRNCVAFTTDKQDIHNRLCQEETKATGTTGGGIDKGYWVWRYQ